MDIKHVKTFVSVVKHGGFSKAADVLNYAQSTVTTHIKALEKELNTYLFDRLGKKVTLTKSGQHFHPYAIELLAIYEKAQEIPLDSNHPEGTLMITANESLAVYRLPQILKTYKQKYPQVNIVIQIASNEQALKELQEGETDIVFLMGEDIEFKDYISSTLYQESFVWILPNDLSPNLDTSNLLQQYQFIYTESSCGYRAVIDQILQLSGKLPTQTFESSSIEVIKQSVKCGLGVSILPFIVVEELVKKKEITFQSIELPIKITSQMFYHKSRWISPVLRSFLDILKV
ncbi:LysR family transcriptional regulator [Chengkuizengella axinellae]|uniref:LysR family transcriptional regulator n=1 Tax=Chengkuizengella axinellae TaxID=3064388 RepID=A0ABT9J4Z6_9BACL|nr:LysR family transcriptional regulator [Chengkuizengella sp. 2205SS18-9]MDP5276542.1 LysR family transcriptional regulator [Chengkuizengella sp. 2205SS18-9]